MSTSTEIPYRLVEGSTAERKVALSSKFHFTGHIVVGSGAGRVLQIESHLEFCWALCLLARPEVVDLREQVGFEWFDEYGEVRTHYFDFVLTRAGGDRVACLVRPAVRTVGRFAETMPRIAQQARQSGFVDEVRLLTDQDLDPIELHNAKMLHGVRMPDREIDAVAEAVVRDLAASATLGELVDRTGLGTRGLRALIRLVRSGHLRLLRSERISLETEVYKRENPQWA